MKISQKLFLGFLTIILLMVIFGCYMFARIGQISEISREIKKATQISQIVLDFGAESFHAQLKV